MSRTELADSTARPKCQCGEDVVAFTNWLQTGLVTRQYMNRVLPDPIRTVYAFSPRSIASEEEIASEIMAVMACT